MGDYYEEAKVTYSSAQGFVERCFTLKYASNNSISSVTGFDPVFRGHIEQVVIEQRDLLEKSGYFDSIIVKINQNGSNVKTPKFMGQSALNFDCMLEATKADYDPLTSYKPCRDYKHVLKFKLSEGFVQDMFVAKSGEDLVNPQEKTNNRELEPTDFSTISSDRFVRMPPEPGVNPDTSFDTIWSMIITLEPSV